MPGRRMQKKRKKKMETMKTNKSYTKRLRVTRKGKIVARVPGQDHFNAKESRRRQLQRGRSVSFTMNNKDRSRFLPKSGNNR